MTYQHDIILIVEDNRFDADLITHMLTIAGVDNWRVVGTGPDALAALDDGPVCLMLIDLSLPGMDGFELIRQVRQRDPEMPLIVVTGVEDGSSRELSKQCGADEFYVKPLHFDYFHREILRRGLRLTVTRRGT